MSPYKVLNDLNIVATPSLPASSVIRVPSPPTLSCYSSTPSQKSCSQSSIQDTESIASEPSKPPKSTRKKMKKLHVDFSPSGRRRISKHQLALSRNRRNQLRVQSSTSQSNQGLLSFDYLFSNLSILGFVGICGKLKVNPFFPDCTGRVLLEKGGNGLQCFFCPSCGTRRQP